MGAIRKVIGALRELIRAFLRWPRVGVEPSPQVAGKEGQATEGPGGEGHAVAVEPLPSSRPPRLKPDRGGPESGRDESGRRKEARGSDSGSSTYSGNRRTVTNSTRTAHTKAVETLRYRSRHIDGPFPVASLAHEVRANVGIEHCVEWFGYGKFASFLKKALPNAEFDEKMTLLMPDRDERDDRFPPAVRHLWARDRDFPNLTINQWKKAYEAIVSANPESNAKRVSTSGSLTNVVCDRIAINSSAGVPVKAIRQIARSIGSIGELRPGMTRVEVENAFVTFAEPGLRSSREPEVEIQHAEAWLRGYATRSPYKR